MAGSVLALRFNPFRESEVKFKIVPFFKGSNWGMGRSLSASMRVKLTTAGSGESSFLSLESSKFWIKIENGKKEVISKENPSNFNFQFLKKETQATGSVSLKNNFNIDWSPAGLAKRT